MAGAALDPTFGSNGQVLGTIDTGTGPDLSVVSATRVQTDGKILVAGTYSRSINGAEYENLGLAVRRYNADGSVDTSFGTNGQVDVPIDTTTSGISIAPNNIAIHTDGTIDVAATTFTRPPSGSSSGTTYNGLVAQVTATGQMDASFGSKGVYALPTANILVNSVALQGDQLLVLGTTSASDLSSPFQMMVFRLTTTGTLDATFGTNGQATINVPRLNNFNFATITPAAIIVAPDGHIDLAADVGYNYVSVIQTYGYVGQVNADGSQNSSFGSGGLVSLGEDVVSGIAAQPDSKLIVAGKNGYSKSPVPSFLIRLLTNGSTDSSFVGLPLSSTTSSINNTDTFNSVALATDGAILVGGIAGPTGGYLVERFSAAGTPDISFGIGGRMVIATPPPIADQSYSYASGGSVAATADGEAIIGATNSPGNIDNRSVLAKVRHVVVLNPATDDFNNDGISDLAVEVASGAVYAVRTAGPFIGDSPDVVQQFGQAGIGRTIPVVGDFDGDGKPDVAAYLPALGDFAYRPSSGGTDVLTQFGPAGTGASIPAPGNYFGTGVTAMAVYIPSQGAFAIRGPGGVGNILTPFGVAGTGQSIPAPGDYDGDGKTDLAVYIPSQGVLAYRPSSGGKDVIVPFGPAGAGASIPAPGDYDGDGKTDVAVYMPASGAFAIHPSSGVANYLIPFGMPGRYNSVPAPGDYDGDGKTDAAVYLPTMGRFAYRPSSGGDDVIASFGQAGYGATVPTTSIPYAFPVVPSGSSTSSTGANAAAAVYIPLTDDMNLPTTLTGATKKLSSRLA